MTLTLQEPMAPAIAEHDWAAFKQPPVAVRPAPFATASIDEILAAIDDDPVLDGLAHGYYRGRTVTLLEHLASLPGSTWQERWSHVDAAGAGGASWHGHVIPDAGEYERARLNRAFKQLAFLDVFRLSYRFLAGRSGDLYELTSKVCDPGGFAELTDSIQSRMHARAVRNIRAVVAKLVLHTGKPLRDLDHADFTEMMLALGGPGLSGRYYREGEAAWRAFAALGWVEVDSLTLPLGDKRRMRQRTPEELVDRYGVTSPLREVFIEYLKYRAPSLDYSSLVNMAQQLVDRFWMDITRHHPEIDSLQLPHEVAEAWKQRLRFRADGKPRTDHYTTLIQVRGFYHDLAQWGLQDSYWAPWVAPCPVGKHEIVGLARFRRNQTARTQQHTRLIAPLLPQLVATAARDRRETADLLNRAKTAIEAGIATIVIGDEEWSVRGGERGGNIVKAERDGTTRDLTREESWAFWSWAVIETLRHTGIRVEEMLELTHLSLVPYRAPETGEEVPLLHIKPSKNDQERLLVVSPELAAVLAELVHRVRGNQQDVPLSCRWDPHERELSPPAPHLFVRYSGHTLKSVCRAHISDLLERTARHAELTLNGEPLTFRPHDFRRIFATEALASGMPPHIVQVILGHNSINSTQIYAAVYPEDVIRHHRAHISKRRQLRPSEEYRQPTAEEWDEFEGHFAKRKVSLGTCGRAYGSNCHHEHACLRCALLRPDPGQISRLEEIIESLHERIVEAQQHNWLGEVDGLRVSLDGAETKLAQMQELNDIAPVYLGLPALKTGPTT